MNKRIIVAEDEPKLAQLMADYLLQAGFEPHIVHTGDAIIGMIDNVQPEALLLDIQMPNKDGISVLKEIRIKSDLPVLMLTARVDEIDRVLGLELGADDYICKPFSPREVIARLKTVLRRSSFQASHTTQNNRVKLDRSRYEFSFESKAITLSAIEFQLLHRMSNDEGRIFSRQQLMTSMYNDHRVVNDRTIDSHIKKLRKKLHEHYTTYEFIHSIYGVGYRFEIEAKHKD